MPSGSRKRKASKKPKPGDPPSSQGEPPELETGLEESMGKDVEETVEGSPSPTATDATSEAVTEVELGEGKELIREASQGEGEVAEAEDASPPHYPVELQPQVPTISAADLPNENQVGGKDPGDIKWGGYPSPGIREEIGLPLHETEQEIEAPPPEIKAEVEANPGTTGFKQDIHIVGVPPIGMDSAEADKPEPRESAPVEMEAEPLQSPTEVEWLADVAQEDTGPENATTTPDVTEVGFEGGVNEEAAEMDAAPGDAQLENDEGTVGRDLDAHAGFASVEPDDTPVETVLGTDEDLVNDQPEIDKAVVKMQPQADAVARSFEMEPVIGAETEIDENLAVREGDADTPAIIEPAASDDGLSETVPASNNYPDVQSEPVEVMEQSQPETDAVPSNLEPEPSAESEFGKEVTQVVEDASTRDEEVEPAGSRIKLQKDLFKGETEAKTDEASVEVKEARPEATMREVDPESEVRLSEIKPEADLTLDDTSKDEVAEQPEERADYTNYDKGAPADIEPEPEERTSIEVGPEENDYSSLEIAADALKGIQPEPEKVTEFSDKIEGPTSSPELEEIVEKSEPASEVSTEVIGSPEDINQGVEPPLEADTQPAEGTTQEFGLGDRAEPADEALMEASEVSGKEDINQGVETPLEVVTEPKGGTDSVYEPEAEAKTELEAEGEVFEPEPEIEVLPESKPDQLGPIETNLDEPDLVKIKPGQLNEEDNDQQIRQQEREADFGVEIPELPGDEADQEELSATNEARLGDRSALPVLDGDALAIGIPTVEQENPKEGEVISPPEEGLTDEGEQGAVLAQPDESKEYTMEQERAGVDDSFADQEEALTSEVHRHGVPSKQDTDADEPPAMTFDKEELIGEEPHAPNTQESQPTLGDKQDLTIDPNTIDVPPHDSEMAEQGLSSTSPPKSEVTSTKPDPRDGVAVQNFDSPIGHVERDVGDEDVALSTAAEAGSVINDYDERASYQQSPVEFHLSEQDADISESGISDSSLSLRSPELQDNNGRDFVDTLSPRAPELFEKGLTDHMGGSEHADSSWEDRSKVSGDSPEDEVEWKAAQDFEPIGVHEEVPPVPKEITMVEAGGDEENRQEAVSPTFGIVPALEYLAAREEELMPKVLPSDSDGLRSVRSTEAPTYEQVTPEEESGGQDNGVVNSEEAEIGMAEANELKAAAASQGEVLQKTSSNGEPLLLASQEKDEQAFRQQNTQEASLPVILPSQDVKQRALVQENSKGNEHARGGGTLQRRTNWLGCCGMIDLLVGKNK